MRKTLKRGQKPPKYPRPCPCCIEKCHICGRSLNFISYSAEVARTRTINICSSCQE